MCKTTSGVIGSHIIGFMYTILHCCTGNQINHHWSLSSNFKETGKFCGNEEIPRFCSKFHGKRKNAGPNNKANRQVLLMHATCQFKIINFVKNAIKTLTIRTNK